MLLKHLQATVMILSSFSCKTCQHYTHYPNIEIKFIKAIMLQPSTVLIISMVEMCAHLALTVFNRTLTMGFQQFLTYQRRKRLQIILRLKLLPNQRYPFRLKNTLHGPLGQEDFCTLFLEYSHLPNSTRLVSVIMMIGYGKPSACLIQKPNTRHIVGITSANSSLRPQEGTAKMLKFPTLTGAQLLRSKFKVMHLF